MHTLEQVYNYFPKGFFERGLKVLHHYGPTSMLVDSEFFLNKKIRLSSDLQIIQVNDELHKGLSKINQLPFENKSQIVELIDDPYVKWISKPKAILHYLKENYDSIPEYVMYVDSSDVVIIDDILNPKEMLDFYQCDVLFNCEPNFASTGFNLPTPGFYNVLFEEHAEEYAKLNLQKYGVRHVRGLNAGIFIGRKDAVLEMVQEAYDYMSANYELGFPYGTMDDQYMFRYLQVKHFDKIACDVYNKFLLFTYPKCIEVVEDDWEHYTHFERTNIHLYQKYSDDVKEEPVPIQVTSEVLDTTNTETTKVELISEVVDNTDTELKVPTITENKIKKCVVTLTTIPARLQSKYPDDIKSCLESLINQTFDDYEIHMNIPYVYKLTGEEYIIPSWLDEMVANNPKLKYFRGEDYGTFTKITDTLRRIDNPECVIIVTDDDLVYHSEMVEEQYNNQTNIFRECAVGYDGMGALDLNFKDVRNHFVVSVPCNVRVNVLQHYKTVSYKRRYFQDDFFTDFLNSSWNDDVAISAYMTKQKIQKYVTYYDKENIPATLKEWQTRGGVSTFPVIRHTQHDNAEGCNLIRAQNVSDNFMDFHAKGYLK